jgi:2-polyprenyl-6-methoxyphenol hydroxylase-like FAD-dependent oxidoreductase
MTSETTGRIDTRCCIAGGGPAGVMLGFLLARRGVDVVVLEKHADFLRDFRGDTVHPSTLEIFHELGLAAGLLARPHQELREVGARFNDVPVVIGDFTHLPVHYPFVALMPQWDFLNFVTERAREFPSFHIEMQAEVTGLIEAQGRVAGVRVKAASGLSEVRADLVVAADGRHSVVRKAAGLAVDDLGAPFDVLWMRLPKRTGDPLQTLGYLRQGRFLVTLDRGDYWQCAFVIPKGAFPSMQAGAIDTLRAAISEVVPFMADRLDAIRGWDDVKLLTVRVDRLRHWSRAGLLCIGDAAHAMSPIGGVGINLAIQDAVAAANLLARPLLRGAPTDAELRAVQRRRQFPTNVTQRLQVFLQKQLVTRLDPGMTAEPPAILRLLNRWPLVRRIPARFLGLGARPEHVEGA